VLPSGFHRIRHYGLLANGNRAANIARARALLALPPTVAETATTEAPAANEQRCCRDSVLAAAAA
jgi:hypothetical protein